MNKVTLLAIAFASAISNVEAQDCSNTDSCISALLESAGAGQHAQELYLMAHMHSHVPDPKTIKSQSITRPGLASETVGIGATDDGLIAVLEDASKDFANVPEYQRALAIANLRVGRPQKAEQVIRQAIEAIPSYSPFWLDLASILSAQGKTKDAVNALIVAFNWTQDQPAMRTAFIRSSSENDSAPTFREALARLDQQKQLDAESEVSQPPLLIGSKDPTTGKNVPRPSIKMETCIKPVWPRSSLRYEETGKVTLAYLIGSDGKVLRAKKLRSSGNSLLDNAALAGMATCTFIPAIVEENPVASWLSFQYVWEFE